MLAGQSAAEGEFSVFETEMAVRPDAIDVNQHVHNSR